MFDTANTEWPTLVSYASKLLPVHRWFFQSLLLPSLVRTAIVYLHFISLFVLLASAFLCI
jgi:hypothetical protein